ncbi:Cysteine proteinase inhibitor [Psidium guajava]|nr:Cysteine proteinase inhibitor [Psidium guajava]
MSETCNSRHFSWLMKSCFPNPHDKSLSPHHHHPLRVSATTLSSLPDDLLLECLSRLPASSLPSAASVCRRWSRILDSPAFSDLRRLHGLLRPAVFALSSLDSTLLSASLRLDHPDSDSLWRVSLFLPDGGGGFPFAGFHGLVPHARLAAVGPRIYIIGRNAVARYDTWTGSVASRSPMTFPRKKFAVAVHSGRIYVAGGGGRTSAVEEYDPDRDGWSVVSHAPRRRYGCVGASVDGVFYVIGGLRIGPSVGSDPPRAAGAEAHVYASSMDLYDVEAQAWLRSRAVPGGGCVVAACSAVGHVYVLASHALELSFWSLDARRKSGGFGEWSRAKSPPLPTQVRLDSTVKFSCVGVGDKVVLVQVAGCIDDLLRRSGRIERGLREGLVLVYDTAAGEWGRAADLPEVMARATCACVEC